MVEETQKSSLSLGHMRMKYLDECHDALKAIGQVGLRKCVLEARTCVDSFVATIKDGSPAAHMITHHFDQIEKIKEGRLKEVEEAKKQVGDLERTELDDLKVNIEYDTVSQKRIECWRVALEKGLFYE